MLADHDPSTKAQGFQAVEDHERSEALRANEVEWCPQRESNPHLALRTGQLYPLSYVGMKYPGGLLLPTMCRKTFFLSTRSCIAGACYTCAAVPKL